MYDDTSSFDLSSGSKKNKKLFIFIGVLTATVIIILSASAGYFYHDRIAKDGCSINSTSTNVTTDVAHGNEQHGNEQHGCNLNEHYKFDEITKMMQCTCKEGYYRNDNSTCMKVEPTSFLLINGGDKNLGYTYKISMDTPTVGFEKSKISILAPTTQKKTRIQFDCLKQKIYSAHIGNDDKINSINTMSYDGLDQENFIDNVKEISTMTIDWISRNIFWIESYKIIKVANLDNQKQMILMNESSPGIDGIAVHPGQGKLYWINSEVGHSRIEMANEDGSNRTKFWPNTTMKDGQYHALTFDWSSNNLCWIDTFSISCLNMESKEVNYIHNNLKYPFFLTVSPDTYFIKTFGRFKTESVSYINKIGNNELGSFDLTGPSTGDSIQGMIFVTNSCPTFENKTNLCDDKVSGCKSDQICLPGGQDKVQCF